MGLPLIAQTDPVKHGGPLDLTPASPLPFSPIIQDNTEAHPWVLDLPVPSS